jgi:inner membrane protease subunit 1
MSGASMLPTFSGDPSEVVVEEMLTHTFFPNAFLNRGDLITLESPVSRGRLVCKRLIGMPGDIVCIDPTGQYADPSEHIIVPKGHVWICGDNLTASRDSRVYGPVPMALVKGRIVARVCYGCGRSFLSDLFLLKIWPPSKWTIFRNGISYLD